MYVESDMRVSEKAREGHSMTTFCYRDGSIYGLGGGLHPLDNGNGENLRLYRVRTPIPCLVSASGWELFFHRRY
jgi:hypothetical protein